MYTKEALLDIHERTHTALRRVIAHAIELAPGQANRELQGFGYGTVRRQLHHAIGAQKYWLSVLLDAVDADDDFDSYPDVASLEGARRAVDEDVRRFVDSTSIDDMNAPRPHENWRGETHDMVAARVLMRTLTHVHHHIGQVTAMCRLLGHPLEKGADFPID